ncbi:MAG: DUF2007 domain-containing protein [Candidatus Omnitrophota bacterium]|jgi:hypothetical protein
MIRLLVYFLLFGILLYLFSFWGKPQASPDSGQTPGNTLRRWFRSKRDPQELWVQVYETDSLDEARMLQARLQEEEVECVVYQQGKKDIHGQPMKGIGITVPKAAVSHAQNIISRMPV